MNESRDTARLAGASLERYRHVCVFYNSTEEEYRVLRSFIAEGFHKGDKAFHVIDEQRRQEHLQRLAALGIDVTATQTTGQLEVRGWENAHLRPGYFNQHAMLALVEDVLTESKRRGFPFTRWVANMGWALADVPGVADLAEYCTRLNYVTPKYKATILCTYDYAKFDVSAIIDVLRTHPAAIIGGILQENPFFVSPDELLRERRERGGAPSA
jgi:MEDS: MEthanogen/methylotroph, DcmR Sensory domain